jgi:CubicO group peptidase (beta-lactamase class C family)
VGDPRRPITVRHLLPHSSGLSYGLLDPGTPMFRAYAEGKVLHDARTLAEGVRLRVPATGVVRGKGHGLAGAVTLEAGSLDAPGSEGALQWGGMAGTHWWISPPQGLSTVLMTQRHRGFWNPYWRTLQQGVAGAA